MQRSAIALSFLLAMSLKNPAFGAGAALRSPAGDAIPVAIVVTEGANVIDFAGPWEVFQDTARPGTEQPAFRLFTVSESRRPVRLTGGLTVLPDFSFDDAPAAAVVVVGAQGRSDGLLQWLRRVGSAPGTDVLMSVCTGAFKLAAAGLLDGKHATTHHDFFDEFARRYPTVTLERGRRYVQSGPHLFTAGGLTSGIDLALHIVALYYGDAAARDVARYMEYHQGQE
jgi:transcriptional regulator GlxA family with amidase domain